MVKVHKAQLSSYSALAMQLSQFSISDPPIVGVYNVP